MQQLEEKHWVHELLTTSSADSTDFKTDDDFKEFNRNLNENWFISIEQVSDFMTANDFDIYGLKEFINKETKNGFRLSEQEVLMLITLASVKFLSTSPNIENWKLVRSLSYNSWHIENWLRPALSFYVNKNNVENDIIRLAKKILHKLISGEYQLGSERYNQITQNNHERWERVKEPLKEIWLGLRGDRNDFIPYLELAPIFNVWWDYEPEDFIKTIIHLNPYLSKSLLAVANVVWAARFVDWENAVKLVPKSFDDEGKYNKEVKSYLLPILLNDAYQNIVEAKHKTENEEYVLSLISNVVDVLSFREDFAAIVMRWSNSLIRITLDDIEDSNDFTSGSYIANELLKSLGGKLNGLRRNFLKKPAEDFEDWEYWCLHCALTDYLHNELITEYYPDLFIKDWELDVFSWGAEKEQQLKNKSFDFCFIKEQLPGKSAYQLAYSFSKLEQPEDVWLAMWNNSRPLREIVQFGFKSDVYGQSYKGRAEASNLLLLLFLIGMALLDLLVNDKESNHKGVIKKLFCILHASLLSVLYMETTIHNDKWFSIYRHLVIRRYIWEDETENIFEAEDEPSVISMLGLVENDKYELAKTIDNILVNTNDARRIKCYLEKMCVKVENLADNVKKLTLKDFSRYPETTRYIQKDLIDANI